VERPTSTEVLGAATEHLLTVGFTSVQEIVLNTGEVVRCFEDSVSIVGLVGFATWTALEARWIDAQSALVGLLSEQLSRNDPKAWEGYLLLFTLDDPPNAAALDAIRRDTTRLRKIVTTGIELEKLSDVDRALLPVLPLASGRVDSAKGRVLDRLPELLADADIDHNLVRRVVAAFDDNRGPMEEIWAWRQEQ
jgi:hypothetical protein